MPQENPPYTDEEKATFRDDPEQLAELHDNLAEMFGIFANAVVDAESPEIADDRARVPREPRDRTCTIPELRERLRPDYRAACKRLIISPDFYDAIQRPNAELVTERDRARRARRACAPNDGVLHELDVLVLATGFHADAFMRPMEVIGRDGATLDRGVDASGRTRTCRSRSPTSRTSSC